MIVIGEKVNASRKTVRTAIGERDAGAIEQAIRAQDEAGADYIDLNAGTGSGDCDQEADDLAWLIDVALGCTAKNLALDSSAPAVLQRASDHLAGRRSWMVNSVNGEQNRLDALLPVAAEQAVPLIALAMDETGIPRQPSDRIAICERILEAANAAGIAADQVFFDPLVLPLSTDVTQGTVTLRTLRALKERFGQVKTTLGLSNVSHGLPRRALVNQAFLIAALSHGLDSAICDPTDPAVRQAILLGDLVAGGDRHCRRFTRQARKDAAECASAAGGLKQGPAPRGAAARPDGNIRTGVLVNPVQRLSKRRVLALHDASMGILQDPGIASFNDRAVGVFSEAGCRVKRSARDGAWIVAITEDVVRRALESAPSRVILGGREPACHLVLDALLPRVYFGTGAEANVVLEMTSSVVNSGASPPATAPAYRAERGSVRRLADSARLCNALEHVDFFIRNVNIQDECIDASNKDVNVAFASLMHMTKHVQIGLTNAAALDHVVRLAEVVAGGPAAVHAAPPISFIACTVKSPLEMLADVTEKAIAIAQRGLPLVISSSPQGGSTGPIQEEGMVAMINAEILAGITLTQLVRPGTPVLYGAVPVRARLDTLHDLYGAPEFVHYNVDCVQMARHYGLPCYSSAGVGDAKVPGLQATVEKVFSQLAVAQSGAQYVHYAVGLLDRTATFCPLQAVLDNANIGVVKDIVRQPAFDAQHIAEAVHDVRKVMGSSTRLFARHIRKQIRRGVVSDPYPLEGTDERDEVIERAAARLADIRSRPGSPLPEPVIEQAYAQVPGLLPRKHFAL